MAKLQTKTAKISFSDIRDAEHLQQANKCYKDQFEIWQKDILQCVLDSSVNDTEIIDKIKESDDIINRCNYIDIKLKRFLKLGKQNGINSGI